MTKINCSITNCSHNSTNVCFANRVDIGGGYSTEDSSTCCGSFLNYKNYGKLTNNTNGSGQCDCLVCNVPSCTNYDNNQCTLSSISVTGRNPQVYSETNCGSFQSK